MRFKQYVSEEERKDILGTLEKLPKAHSDLVKDYQISFQPSNSLKGDSRHIGFIDEKNKKITLSAPWNYGREYTFLHEIGHAVWNYLVGEDEKKEWKKIVEKTRSKNKKDLDQNDEEIFCMTYAQRYAKNKLCKYDHDELVDFVSKI